MATTESLPSLLLKLFGIALVVDGAILGIGFLVYFLTQSEGIAVLFCILLLLGGAIWLGEDRRRAKSKM